VNLMSPSFKTRRYDSSRRRDAARARLERVLDAARELFLERGYAATTVAAVADSAGVSPETIYKALGSKAGLVRALHERALEGAGPVPAEQRSDALRGAASAQDVIAGWARLATEVAPRVVPILLLVREAAASDPEMLAAYAGLDEVRHRRMRSNAKALADRGFLRSGVSVTQAADLMFAVSSPEMYELLVLRCRWPLTRYTAYVRETLTHSLLD
jgi:AcrR family transcriptional regulator